MKRRNHRGITTGTVAMVLISLVVVAGAVLLLQHLIDRHELYRIADLTNRMVPDKIGSSVQAPVSAAPQTSTPKAASVVPVATRIPERQLSPISLNFGGSVALETSIRQSGYHKADATYDFSEILESVAPSMQGDLSVLFMENLIAPGEKVSDLIAPAELADMYVSGGADMISMAFSKVLDLGLDGVHSTRMALESRGLDLAGVCDQRLDSGPESRIHEVAGWKIAILSYVWELSRKGTKASQDQEIEWSVSTIQEAEDEIRQVRNLGADAVIVCVSWGTAGDTAPSSRQVQTAQRLADTGADLIVGAGSRRVQKAELLTASDGRRVLCAYSLGALLCESTKTGAMESCILHVKLSLDSSGRVQYEEIGYVPTFTWRQKISGTTRYRVIPANGEIPQGMNSEQKKKMANALSRVTKQVGNALASMAVKH